MADIRVVIIVRSEDAMLADLREKVEQLTSMGDPECWGAGDLLWKADVLRVLGEVNTT